MKLAVTYEDGMVFQHFGHTESFKLYDIDDGKIVSAEVVPVIGEGHGALAGFLSSINVDALICGGIGAGARNALDMAGIALYPGVSGFADTAALAFANQKLSFDPNTMCSHHHNEGHSCGEHHSCGGGSCHS